MTTRQRLEQPAQYSSGDPASSRTRGSVASLASLTDVQEGHIAPWGAKWRSSPWFITLVVALGTSTDILTYTIVVPVLPYRLQEMGYTDVSGLTAWLLFAYSAGIFIFTFPIAYFFHKHPYRRVPLVVAVIILELSLVLFMLARPYWAMVVSRFLQGAASTVVWSVGFALICENVEEENVGRQIGFAMAGVSIGSTIAPPIGGALYDSLGWHAPFIFCIIICTIDLILRLFVLERADIRKFHEKRLGLEVGALKPKIVDGEIIMPSHASLPDTSFMQLTTAEKEKLSGVELTPWQVLGALGRSGRGMTSLMTMFCFGLIIGSTEPTLTLRVQSLWDKSSEFVGLVYLAAAAPTFFCGPVVGALADKYGAEWFMVPSMILTLPWLPLLLLKKSLAGFIVFFAFVNLFPNAAMAPTGLEVTMVSRKVPGISEIHQFSAMNIAFAVSTAVGTIAGGQMYDNLKNGWSAVIWFSFAAAVAILPPQFFFSGNISLYRRLFDGKVVRESDEEKGEGAVSGGARDEAEASQELSPRAM
ncbi:hypothetical protein IAR50_004616 [Cryptococcus sp. DSM 104548]